MVYKNFSSTILKSNDDERVITATISSEEVDEQGDIVKSNGLQFADYLKRGGLFLHEHKINELPIGRVLDVRQSNGITEADIRFSKHTEKANTLWQMVKDKELTGFSVGLKINDFQNQNIENKSVRVITKSELIELSLTSAPANLSAQASAECLCGL